MHRVLLATVAAGLSVTMATAPAAAGVPGWTTAPPPPVPLPAVHTVLHDAVVSAPGDVWVVGSWWDSNEHAYAVHWNGTGWDASTLPGPWIAGTGLEAVDAAGGEVWAVGHEGFAAEDVKGERPLLLHGDAAGWRKATPPALNADVAALNDVDLDAAGSGWAVGEQRNGDGPTRPLVLRLSGSVWTEAPTPVIDGAELESVYAGGSDVWAAGSRPAPGGGRAPMMLRLVGGTWVDVALPVMGGKGDTVQLQSVAGLGKDVWAAGSRCLVTGPSCTPVVFRLVGSVWQAAAPVSTGVITAVVPLSPTDVWFIGYTGVGTTTANNLAEHWNGKTFTLDPTVTAKVPPNMPGAEPASAIALYGAAGDPATGTVWAVGWIEDNGRVPQALHRP